MQITVVSRHVDLPEEMKEYSRKKAEKLLRFYDRIQSIEVLWDGQGDQVSVELIVRAGARSDFVAKEVGTDGMALVDLTIDKLERQLTKHKEKSRNRMHTGRIPPETD
ncbi:MAG: ribosome-associated translation inhibitor RaiA [Phycisphaerales bacterium]|nr:ribosome-associated translation inhibitor RaiA [Phycisphaerales bacterium]